MSELQSFNVKPKLPLSGFIPANLLNIGLLILIMGCQAPIEKPNNEPDATMNHTTFQVDLDFLNRFIEPVVLSNGTNEAQIAIAGALQGRIMTSTSQGQTGRSYGWINRPLFESGDTLDHMNAFGGEERLWLGPEGGQYSIFFKADDPFDLEHWQTPRLIDLDPFDLIEKSDQKAVFEQNAVLTNYSNFTFRLRIERTIEILSREEIFRQLHIPQSEVSVVAYQTTNQLTNTGMEDWKTETGLLSIWLLGMYNPSPSTTIIIPYEQGDTTTRGQVANDTYFGKVPPDRLKIKPGIIFFRGDGQYRSKIGLGPKRAKNIFGSYDTKNNILTIVKYNKPEGVDQYVNSQWEIQDEPYQGDVLNSYNDGPPEPGKAPLGPFYELETSSPALTLKKGESASHTQETYHFEGTEKVLDQIMQQLLGVNIQEVKDAF
ncbi:MAG: hypothetical protein IPL46_29390 [Saprospiraceae bacterium]|nr:hypothetical protein [Saprospiraceae bacterium]